MISFNLVSKIPVEAPYFRKLRVLAFDPSLAINLETAEMNQLTLDIPWEDLALGPIGEYIEVIDYDPASGVFYEPVNLEDSHLIARDGLTPSESNPQFHQQMVYAVVMTTIKQFERALGRVAFWSDRVERLPDGRYIDQFVRRLRVYPHALRDKNAYYSPAKKALLFGYFPITSRDPSNSPGTLVFTCLSHDIIAHEVTHALLDGVHPRFNDATNIDVHAFHEAFADIVALFQHFSYPQVLENQIKKTRGNLQSENLLGQLAQEFGRATGRGAALRDALGGINKETGEWELRSPDPFALNNVIEPHARGAILVAAVFRAFLLIYSENSADLFRIATQGTGNLPEGDIHPDLTNRLSQEAAEAADRVLQMCIRAIDYCPPLGITFGDFLRGVITADLDFSPQNEEYRIVFIQSFREWGILPKRVTSTGIDGLKWPSADEMMRNTPSTQYQDTDEAFQHRQEEQSQKRVSMKEYMRGNFLSKIENWNLESDRFKVWNILRRLRIQVHNWLKQGDAIGRDYGELFGLVIYKESDMPQTIYCDQHGDPTLEVHSVRPTVRQTIAGSFTTDIVVEVTQRRRGYFDPLVQEEKDKNGVTPGEDGDFTYRAGCTIIINPTSQEIRRIIRTPDTIRSNQELNRLRDFIMGDDGVVGNSFNAGFVAQNESHRDEPFYMLHKQTEE
ncbi:hypothetical protein [Flagellimonas algicola]|uniref:Peptidase M4 n=1 Tax=Flagellimonas algicola TaxID=2583815 RepID=A0ABY2WRX2_9FLAO|nr:hypothetical protein [Allomuricauda algicola]TMU57490.1 hypothetical protein FGG15_08080 [Allomuricauda algicola]